MVSASRFFHYAKKSNRTADFGYIKIARPNEKKAKPYIKNM
jgi:hypothetical protein